MGLDVEWIEEIGDFEVPWQECGAEWLDKMHELSGYSGSAGYTTEGQIGGPVLVELQPDGSGPGNPRVLIIPRDDGRVTVALAGSLPKAGEAVKSHWLDIAQQATSALSIPDSAHKWTALIGQKPSQVSYPTVKLGADSRACQMSLTQSETALVEPVVNTVSSLNSWHMMVSFPIEVRGTATARTWQDAEKKAARDVNRLAALLSLAWDTPIDVRDRPSLTTSRVPRETPRYPHWSREIPVELPAESQFLTVSVPAWLGDAWKKLNGSRKLDSALAMHMEGVRILDNHPSLALVSFVSCIEAISLMIYREDRCSACRGHVRIADKFRETLKRVASDSEATYLHRVYNDRSRTVHDGRLHGGEMWLGLHRFGIISPPEAEFTREVVRRMQSASAKLLLLAAQSGLPQARIHLD
ncbi:hypothetical protein [Streptomyces sp. NPDC088766]|uniref:hypothetical protein n=1 Tax=Streptomyces sp. NPDC088766 TaxID=3365893 RepID=UPI003819A50C